MNIAVYLPANVTHKGLIDLLSGSGAISGDWENLVIHVPEQCFIDQGAIALLCTWDLAQKMLDRKIEFNGGNDTCRYLSRMNVFEHLDFDYDESFNRHAETGRFTPARLINDSDDVFYATNDICDLVLHQFDNGRVFLPAVEWAVNEIIGNISLHSETPVPGVVSAQYYPKRNRLDIAIVDYGRGIYASLAESRQLWSHGDAITTAIQRGVTRSTDIGQGNGLAGSTEITRLNGGEMHIWTGDADFTIKNGHDKGFTLIPEMPGTGVFLRLNTRHPVELKDTFIGDSGWTYLNYESERLDDAGGLRIKDECFHTGTREPAKALRRKIESLLPEMEQPLILDFEGVTSASSSFLDELLGRLAKLLGAEAFLSKIHVKNIDAQISDIANVVIHQRLEGVSK